MVDEILIYNRIVVDPNLFYAAPKLASLGPGPCDAIAQPIINRISCIL